MTELVAAMILCFLWPPNPLAPWMASCSFRLVDDLVVAGFGASFSSLGLGPRTPRQAGLPHRHSWMFLEENGLENKLVIFNLMLQQLTRNCNHKSILRQSLHL